MLNGMNQVSYIPYVKFEVTIIQQMRCFKTAGHLRLNFKGGIEINVDNHESAKI